MRAASRRRVLTYTLLGLCAALAALAFLPPPPGGPVPDSPARVTPATLETGTEAAFPVRRGSTDSPAFRRPIFVPSRRLPADGGTGSKTTPIEGLKLKAVFLGPEVAKALFETAGTPDGRWVKAGQSVEGWRLEEIHPERAVLAGPGGQREVELEKPEAAPASRSRRARRRTAPAQQKRGAQDAPAAESGENEPKRD